LTGLRDDLDSVIDMAADDLRIFRNARIYLTGGTGFVGTWMLASIVRANARQNLHISVDVLSRNPGAFGLREAELSRSPGVRVIEGDVRAGVAHDTRHDAVIHTATPTAPTASPRETFDSMVAGDRAALEAAALSGNIPFLYTSSGAVYGRQPPSCYALDEKYTGAPDPLVPGLAYHHGKRTGELLCAMAASEQRVAVKIARLFAFVGPHLPLERNFAVGNFVGDALRSAPIVVRGDGTPVRSYLYASDMAVWLWAILARGTVARAYNVGSESPLSIEALANRVSEADGRALPVEVRGKSLSCGQSPERYVPDTERVRHELGVAETVGLSTALRRTLAFHRKRSLRPNDGARGIGSGGVS
jgi:dTDP-glucose 4,6-dehydratase